MFCIGAPGFCRRSNSWGAGGLIFRSGCCTTRKIGCAAFTHRIQASPAADQDRFHLSIRSQNKSSTFPRHAPAKQTHNSAPSILRPSAAPTQPLTIPPNPILPSKRTNQCRPRVLAFFPSRATVPTSPNLNYGARVNPNARVGITNYVSASGPSTESRNQ